MVHTYSGYENKVASNLEKTVENRQLQDLIQEIRVPTEKVTEITDSGKRKEVERKLSLIHILYTSLGILLHGQVQVKVDAGVGLIGVEQEPGGVHRYLFQQGH